MIPVKLLYQTHSPYARKVLVAAHEMGLQDQLTVIHHETSPTRRNDAVFALNPLGKVPVLICNDRAVLFDSNVICEYLDGLHPGPPLIPSDPQSRFRALKLQALAQGIADAGITARWESERRPPDLRWPIMHDGQLQKIAAACDFLEQQLDAQLRETKTADVGDGTQDVASVAGAQSGRAGPRGRAAQVGAATAADPRAPHNSAAVAADRLPLHIGDIALATALSWIEFRRVYDFLPNRPRLARWYAALCARPSMRATTSEGQTCD